MGASGFDTPALLMRLGADHCRQNPTLGEAIAHIMQQPSDERWLFDVITEDGLIAHGLLRELHESEAYRVWSARAVKI